MFALLNPRLIFAAVLLAALAFSHFTVYRKGRNDVKLEWQAATARADSEARALERRRQDRADEAGRLATARQDRIGRDAALARGDADGLRDTLDAVERASKESSDAASRSFAAVRGSFEECTRAYLGVAEEADRLASDSLTLQQAWPR